MTYEEMMALTECQLEAQVGLQEGTRPSAPEHPTGNGTPGMRLVPSWVGGERTAKGIWSPGRVKKLTVL